MRHIVLCIGEQPRFCSPTSEEPDVAPGFTCYAPTAGPSRWLLIVGRRFLVCVESTVTDSIVDAVWWLADSDLATLEAMVGAFPLAGPDSVRSFAVAELGEPDASGEIVATAVVRGSAVVDVFSVEGSRRFDSGGAQPWLLAEFRNITGLALCGEGLPVGQAVRLSGSALPVGRGIVNGELLTWSGTLVHRIERGNHTVESAECSPFGADFGGSIDETIIRDRSSRPFARPEGRTTPDEESWPLPTESFTVAVPSACPSAPSRFAVRVGTGDMIELDTPIVIGRGPASLRIESGAAVRVVTVLSREQEVSSSHVRIERSGDAVVVTDLRSTNGTRIVRPGGTTTRMRPGESMVVLSGTAIDIGDGNLIEISAIPVSGSRWMPRPQPGADRREEGSE